GKHLLIEDLTGKGSAEKGECRLSARGSCPVPTVIEEHYRFSSRAEFFFGHGVQVGYDAPELLERRRSDERLEPRNAFLRLCVDDRQQLGMGASVESETVKRDGVVIGKSKPL